jgi:hypothetical protein
MNTKTRTIHDTHNGINIEYDIDTPIPRLPLNLDATLRRALFTLAAFMTIGAIIWGTVAIGSMLTLLAPTWAAYLVAGVFDAGWAGCLIAEWLLRYDSKRSALPRKTGMAMLTVSMAAIFIHGLIAGAWAVGIVGALVSAAAKGVWAIGMHTVRIKLDPKHEAYLRALQQQAGTELALALGERDRLLTQDRTVSLKLALEARQPDVPSIVRDRPDTHMDTADTHMAIHGNPRTSADQSTTDTRKSETDTHQDTVDIRPDTQMETQRLSTQDTAVPHIATLIRRGKTPTIAEVMELTGRPQTTAQRWLTKAKNDAGTGLYL